MSVETKELQRLAAWHEEQRDSAAERSDWTEKARHLDAAQLLRRVATILAAPLPPSSLPPAPPPEDE